MVADTPTAAACSNVRFAGLRTRWSALVAAYSANAPAHQPKTSSPGRNPWTLGAHGLHDPRDVRAGHHLLGPAQPRGQAHHEGRAAHELPSRPRATDAAWTRTSTSGRRPMAGRSMSRAWSTAVEPYRSWTIACIWGSRFLLLRGRTVYALVCTMYTLEPSTVYAVKPYPCEATMKPPPERTPHGDTERGRQPTHAATANDHVTG